MVDRLGRLLSFLFSWYRPSTFVTTLIALLQEGGVKHAMLPMPGLRAMAALVSCYRVVRVDVCAPFDKGRLAVCGHVA